MWSALDVALGQGLRFVITVVLARLLSPSEFGTVALLALFIGVASVFVESGLGQALIQRQDVSDEDLSTVFWFNVVVAILVAGVLVAASPAIATFFGKPVLVPLTAVMALNIAISAFGTVHNTIFVKRLAFKPLMVIGAIGTVVSGTAAIACAAAGYGIWSLAAQTLVAGLTTTLLLWIINPWRPRFLFSLASARRLFGFGGYMLASSLLDIVYKRAYTMLIGKFYGTADLGQFARAEGTAALPTTLLTSTIARVAFPALASISDDPARVRKGLRLGLQATMLANAPAMLGLAAVADPFIATLYGPQWRPAVPLLQVLCISGVLMPLHVLNLQVLMALGRSDLFFRLEVIKKIFGVAVLIAASHFGPVGIAWGIVVAGVISLVINTSQTRHLIGYGVWRQLRDVAPVIGLALVMAGVVWKLGETTSAIPSSMRFLAGIAVGTIFYSGLAMALNAPAIQGIKRALYKRTNHTASL